MSSQIPFEIRKISQLIDMISQTGWSIRERNNIIFKVEFIYDIVVYEDFEQFEVTLLNNP